MADTKISALPASTTPLAGTEVLPIVQSGATKQVSVANLTAGRTIATAGASFTDNFTQSTAAKGINFTANTPATGSTSQLLNWYEEGSSTVTAICDSGTITLTNNTIKWARIGKSVTVTGYIDVASVSSPTGNVYFGNLPYAASMAASSAVGSLNSFNAFVGNVLYITVQTSQSVMYFFQTSQTTGNLSGAAALFKAGSAFSFSLSYIVA